MKKIVAILSLLFCASTVSTAMAAGTFYNLNAELDSALQLIEEAEYEKAIQILKDATNSEPDNADAWNLLGYASRKNGDLEQSADAYDKALKLDPEHKNALEYQGELYLMLGDKASAHNNLQMLKSLCPQGCEQLDELMAAIADQP